MSTGETMNDRWDIYATVTGDKAFTDGTTLRLMYPNGGGRSWQFEGVSNTNRKIQKYVPLKRVSDWRVEKMAAEDVVHGDEGYATEAEAYVRCPKNT